MNTFGKIFGEELNIQLNKDIAEGIINGISLNKEARIMTINASFNNLICWASVINQGFV